MPVTCFSKKEWTSILSPAKTMALKKARISSSFPSDVLYGSIDWNCFFFEDPYKKQGIEKIAHFLQEMTNKSLTGNIIKSGTENFVNELGYNSTTASIPWERAKKYVTE